MILKYKYRIYPTIGQEIALANLFGCCRKVYNLLLAENNAKYEVYRKTGNISDCPKTKVYDLSARLTEFKHTQEHAYLNNVCAQSLQQVCTHLSSAFDGLFKYKRRQPKFKRRSRWQKASFTNQTGYIKDGNLKLGRIENTIKVKWHRSLPTGKYSGCIVTKDPDGKYYVSFIVEVEQRQTNGQGILGIDLGLTDLATLSNGIKLVNPKHFVKAQKHLRKEQRRLARKQKGSKNREKCRIKVAKCYKRVSNQRNDYIHKFTTSLIRENQAICVENLNVKGMVRNHRLAKHIADATWGEIKRQLEYKAKLHTGCKLYVADRWYPSSQTCSTCDTLRDAKLALKERSWVCPHCSTHHDRDINAAKNLEKLATKHHPDWKDAKEAIVLL